MYVHLVCMWIRNLVTQRFGISTCDSRQEINTYKAFRIQAYMYARWGQYTTRDSSAVEVAPKSGSGATTGVLPNLDLRFHSHNDHCMPANLILHACDCCYLTCIYAREMHVPCNIPFT